MQRGYFCALILTLLLSYSPLVSADLLVHPIDVGYGEAILLQERRSGLPDNWVLVDAGPLESSGTLRFWLKKIEVKVLGAVFITHTHPNHYQGLLAVVDHIPIQKVYWAGSMELESKFPEFLKHMELKKIPVEAILASSSPFRFGNLVLQVLHPDRIQGAVHDDSLVLLGQYDSVYMLFAGDLSMSSQARVAPRLVGKPLQWATWPHHGDQLHPEWERLMAPVLHLVVGVGPNPWGLPKFHDYPLLAGRALRTDKVGTFSMITNGKTPLKLTSLDNPNKP